jgi:hypothetical protein
MSQTIRCKQRSKSRAATGKDKSRRMADVFLRHVLRNDAKREARAEMREYDREVNKVRPHHTSDRTITVFRRG